MNVIDRQQLCCISRRIAVLESAPPAASFAPDNIASLECWLDASQLGLADNTPVASWTDMSGKGRHFVQATGASQPLVKTGVANSNPAVRFDGINDYLFIPEFMVSATQGEMFLVIKFYSDPPQNSAMLQMSGDHNTNAFLSNRTIYEGWGSTSRKDDTGPPALNMASAFRIYSVRSAPGAWGLFINTVSHFSTASNIVSFDPIDNTYMLGRGDVANSFPLKGDIAEVCIFSTVLTTPERDNMHAYFNSKYALGI